MADYSIGQQQSQNFNQSTAFAAALQRAKQVITKNSDCRIHLLAKLVK